jgi:hypothetical protein
MSKLYQISDKTGAPKYLVDEIMKTITSEMKQGFKLEGSPLPSRDVLLAKAQKYIPTPAPEPIQVEMESGGTVTVWRNNFPHLLQEHLLSPIYSQRDALDLPNPAIPFSSKPLVPPDNSSPTSSLWYSMTYKMHETELASGQSILHPLILYIDKTGVDGIMKNSVEPLYVYFINPESEPETGY